MLKLISTNLFQSCKFVKQLRLDLVSCTRYSPPPRQIFASEIEPFQHFLNIRERYLGSLIVLTSALRLAIPFTLIVSRYSVRKQPVDNGLIRGIEE